MNKIIFGAGRISRLHYLLWNVALGVAAAVLFAVTSTDSTDPEAVSNAAGSAFLGWVPLVWLSAAVATRRAHDRNHSGWFVVLLFVPVVNLAVSLYLLLAPSFEMPNRYGEPPTRQVKLTAAELEQARALLAEEEAEAVRQREKDLLNEDGTFDMDGLFRHNPGARHDQPPPTPKPRN